MPPCCQKWIAAMAQPCIHVLQIEAGWGLAGPKWGLLEGVQACLPRRRARLPTSSASSLGFGQADPGWTPFCTPEMRRAWVPSSHDILTPIVDLDVIMKF